VDGNYESHLKIISATSGTQDPDTGAWTPDGAATTIYDDECDAQEMSQKGLEIAKSIDGVQDLQNVLEVYLKDEYKLNSIPINASGTLTRNGEDLPVKVMAKRVIDGVLIIESNP
jgi:hypothetical protein